MKIGSSTSDNGEDETVLIDPKLEARFYIEHAWINFNKLGMRKSHSIRKFHERDARAE